MRTLFNGLVCIYHVSKNNLAYTLFFYKNGVFSFQDEYSLLFIPYHPTIFLVTFLRLYLTFLTQELKIKIKDKKM